LTLPAVVFELGRSPEWGGWSLCRLRQFRQTRWDALPNRSAISIRSSLPAENGL